MSESVQTVGRRKTSVARVKLIPGKGEIAVNHQILDAYFHKDEELIAEAIAPLKLLKVADKYDVEINVYGGGPYSQAEAIRHGIARALDEVDTTFHIPLKKAGFLTRDPRMVERKKPGKPKARKRFQFSKR